MQETSLLQQCVLFQHLSSEDLEMVRSIARREEFEPDRIIFNKGDKSTALYLIVEGSVRVSVIIDGIGEEVIAILKNGGHFGEMALVDEGPRSATVLAMEKTVCLRIDKRFFDVLIASNADLELKILRNMVKAFSARVRDTDQSLTFLRFTLRKD